MSIKHIGSRASRFLAALGLLAGIAAPLALNTVASAATYTLFSPRSVTMTNSAASATNVGYTFNFTTSSGGSQTVGSFVAQVCTDPFVGATCTAPDATFNWNKASTTVTSSSGYTGLSVDTTDSTANTLVLTRSALPVAASQAVSIALSANVTNPSTVGTFYMRLYGVSNTTGSLATLQDAGGIALSTTNASAITINSKVQESLTFCAYTGGTNCATATYNALALGDANGILSTTSGAGSDYTANGYFDVATNSAHGTGAVGIYMSGNTLKSGSNSITATGAGAGPSCTLDSTAGTSSQFGFRVSTLGTNMAADNGYACSANNHEFDITSGTNLTSVGGEEIAQMNAATAETQNVLEFMAKASSTQLAGIYTTTLNLIAVPSY